MKQEASNKKVIINIDASTGIGKSYEAESFRITIQMHNSVQASEIVRSRKLPHYDSDAQCSTGIGKSYKTESFRITIQMHNSVQASENRMTQKSGAHKENLLFA